nr:6033_t:CDS:2 [Entrophospora candida]
MDIFELKYVAMAIRRKVPLRRRIPSVFIEKQPQQEEEKQVKKKSSLWKIKLEDLMNDNHECGNYDADNLYSKDEGYYSGRIKILKRNHHNGDFRYGIDKDFIKNGKKSVSQLILYWESRNTELSIFTVLAYFISFKLNALSTFQSSFPYISKTNIQRSHPVAVVDSVTLMLLLCDAVICCRAESFCSKAIILHKTKIKISRHIGNWGWCMTGKKSLQAARPSDHKIAHGRCYFTQALLDSRAHHFTNHGLCHFTIYAFFSSFPVKDGGKN